MMFAESLLEVYLFFGIRGGRPHGLNAHKINISDLPSSKIQIVTSTFNLQASRFDAFELLVLRRCGWYDVCRESSGMFSPLLGSAAAALIA
jgi:hypothetical protein